MVCIAAFIILILVGIVVAFLSIFNRTLGRKYLKVLKKSWYCFSKRVTLQKCDTNFADDVKTSILKKVILKKPEWVKPLSITIEAVSVLVIIVTVWSIIEGAKAGLALWTLGTCNVSQPANCALGADSCALDEEGLNWFEEWGEIIGAIPERLKTWNVNDYNLTPAYTLDTENSENLALSIIDPGCSVCRQSFKNMQTGSFLENHQLRVVIYPIRNSDGSYRFANSELITRYIYAADQTVASKIIEKIFTEGDENNINYQSVMNSASHEKAKELLDGWLEAWVGKDQAKEIIKKADSDEVKQTIEHNREIVDNEIKPKGIPTMIYDGGRHLGLFKN
ncbi:hypothetical protein IJJ46_00425 [Candidatus Saccharibacteria bacterium]|nr:hypothetical protein [Candidatus Saccharibacteria bacterium]